MILKRFYNSINGLNNADGISLRTLHWKFHIFKRIRPFQWSLRSTFVQFFFWRQHRYWHRTRHDGNWLPKFRHLYYSFQFRNELNCIRFCTLGEFPNAKFHVNLLQLLYTRLKIVRFYRKNNAGTDSHRVHGRNTCAKTFVILSM